MALTDYINPAGSVVGSLIGAGADIYMNQQNNKFNAQQSELNRRFQTSEREAAQQWNLDMWNLSNAYNTPEAQIQRLLDAGFNPVTAMSMMSESGNVTTPPTTSGQSGSQASAAGISQPGDLLSSAVKEAAQVANINANTDKTKSEAGLVVKIGEAQIKEMEAHVHEMEARKDVDSATAKQILTLLPLIKDKTSTELDVLKKSVEKMNAEITKINRESSNLEKSGELIDENVKNARFRNARESFLQMFRDAGLDLEVSSNVGIIAQVLGADNLKSLMSAVKSLVDSIVGIPDPVPLSDLIARNSSLDPLSHPWDTRVGQTPNSLLYGGYLGRSHTDFQKHNWSVRTNTYTKWIDAPDGKRHLAKFASNGDLLEYLN